jgi:hypothetical protein
VSLHPLPAFNVAIRHNFLAEAFELHMAFSVRKMSAWMMQQSPHAPSAPAHHTIDAVKDNTGNKLLRTFAHLLRAPPSASARAANSRAAGSSPADSTAFVCRRACEAAAAVAAPSSTDTACSVVTNC